MRYKLNFIRAEDLNEIYIIQEHAFFFKNKNKMTQLWKWMADSKISTKNKNNITVKGKTKLNKWYTELDEKIIE